MVAERGRPIYRTHGSWVRKKIRILALQGLNIKVFPVLPRLRSDGKGLCSSGMLSGVAC
jgi:hypothetical protein